MSSTNHFSIVGHLAAAPTVFPSNSDGSRKVSLTAYTTMDYKDSKGQQATCRIQAEHFINAKNVDALLPTYTERLIKGSLIAIEGHIEIDSYTDKTGQVRYEQKLKMDRTPVFLDSKAVTDARRAEQQAEAATATQPDTAPQANVQVNPAASAQTDGQLPVSADQPVF